MPLVDIPLVGDTEPGRPHAADALLDEAGRRIDDYFAALEGKSQKGFVVSNYRQALRALEQIQERELGVGHTFCEWGSGFGVVAALAAMLGYEAYGIEHNPELVGASRRLAADFELPVAIAEADYVPEGFDSYYDPLGESRHLLRTSGRDQTDSWERQLGLGMEDMSVVFVYPWPAEAQFIEELFEASASEGTLLLSYTEHDVRLRRLVVGGHGDEEPEA